MERSIVRIVFLILVAGVGYVLVTRYHRRLSRKQYLAVFVFLFMIAFLWILDHFGLLAKIGNPYYLRVKSVAWVDYTAVFVGMFGAFIQLETNRRKKPEDFASRHNGLFLSALIVLPLYIHPIILPPNVEYVNEWKGDVCIQSTGYSCGPAAMATYLNHYGIRKTEEQLAEELYLSRQGTSGWIMARYLKDRGFRVSIHKTSEKPETLPVPCIAFVGLGGRGASIMF